MARYKKELKKVPTMMLLVMMLSLGIAPSEADQDHTFTWVQEYDNYDNMVAITYYARALCSGVLISRYAIATTAVPFKHYSIQHGRVTVWYLRCHVVRMYWNENKWDNIAYVHYHHAYYKKGYPTFGKNRVYGPRHDYAILTTERCIPYKGNYWKYRHPRVWSLWDTMSAVISPWQYFTIVGHGFVDRIHIEQMRELEAIDYKVTSVLVDCDEWIPRDWGLFICILNIENFIGINSGAMLALNGAFVGLASFTLTRGNESIFVFTDVRKYMFSSFTSSQQSSDEMWTADPPGLLSGILG